ncbi:MULTISPECIES: hypothetical protein [unclassified Dolichospermum]|uniref:hypothetical protein n=1 Tax=unclassified Dolichospermum TaxID=2622029 RepID=UPI00144685D4|nr:MULTISPECIES: hypothetical protein [unclassified Dolichospermum]MTJ19285.1 hypothetical protein [Dolichospermum sp. UHCC 0299]MTJ41321.1 hypothetical protein [Dolichospermum sp. UHCC 0406]
MQVNVQLGQLNQIIATGLIITNIIFLFSSSAQAQAKKPSVECNAALQRAKKQIQKNRKVKVVYTGQEDISQHYKSYPTNRPFSYEFGLKGPATDSILNSDKFLTIIATDIINNCPSISRVEFGESNTDHVATYGLLSNNKVGWFKCIGEDDPGTTIKPMWGQVVCI